MFSMFFGRNQDLLSRLGQSAGRVTYFPSFFDVHSPHTDEASTGQWTSFFPLFFRRFFFFWSSQRHKNTFDFTRPPFVFARFFFPLPSSRRGYWSVYCIVFPFFFIYIFRAASSSVRVPLRFFFFFVGNIFSFTVNTTCSRPSLSCCLPHPLSLFLTLYLSLSFCRVAFDL